MQLEILCVSVIFDMTKTGTKKTSLKTVKWSQIFSFIKFDEEPENGNFESKSETLIFLSV